RLEAVKWNLLRVEVKKRTLHIADTPAERSWGPNSAESFLASAGAQLSMRELPVAKDAKITFDGRAVTLKDLHHDVNLSLKFAADKPIVTVLAATTPPQAGYVVKEVNVEKSTIVVTLGKNGQPLTLTVARDAFLPRIDALKNLKVGAHVAVHLVVED